MLLLGLVLIGGESLLVDISLLEVQEEDTLIWKNYGVSSHVIVLF